MATAQLLILSRQIIDARGFLGNHVVWTWNER